MTAVADALLIMIIVVALIGARIAFRANQLKNGRSIPTKGILNRIARRWHAVIIQSEQLRDTPKPDRTPEEVDALRRLARKQRLETERPEERHGRAFVNPSVAITAARTRYTPAIAFDPNRPEARAGTAISFEYVDANGVITDRELRNWQIDGPYLDGFCLLRRANRQFRLDRVIEWRRWS